MTALSEAILPSETHDWGTMSVDNFRPWEFTLQPVSSIVLVQVSELSDQARDILGKIKAFSQLRENWDSYGAERPSKSALLNASSFVRCVDKRRLPFFFTSPGPNGEVLVEFRQQNKSIEIVFENDGTSSYVKFDGETCVEEGSLTDQNISALAVWLQS